ncbi:membrane glycosyltransferase [Neorhodopirellula lusitana]|uniref:Glucans biosynthesis glucosyltransferase H n=1 Tax=Neorhodopirellula lusitana TaxID=445327 RepID=A0ABY1PPS9_9BACT|nr:glucans biosynthesis glucosyltransferase MdoH [Neorhodopirellula lusitana]SMP39875.1 membrane glycosyltransferase [Neorhodopirellula lusitana]
MSESARLRHDQVTRRTRWCVGILTALIWGLGVFAFAAVIVGDSKLRVLEAFSLILFAVLFAWIAFSFALSVVGYFGLRQFRRAAKATSSDLSSDVSGDGAIVGGESRTAILMPVYNESPTRVFAAVASMREQLQCQAGTAGQFDFYILSDTTDPEIWLEEECCWSQLIERFNAGQEATNPTEAASDIDVEADINVYYRHRSQNSARKAGNIADFCENWGGLYEFMIVLDADSLMSGSTMAEMVRRMSVDRSLGILQVPPVPIGRMSLFARLQQFAAAVYGPMFAEGFDRFAGDQGNYWGHNAIIRVNAFMQHCQLPVLPGEAPLGGEILSHDFVEAALMVKAGWKVRIANDLGGSYEECPTTVLDFAKRDQRWCQGNLQHWHLLIGEGVHRVSRLHFLSGILSYMAAPLWLAFLVVCLGAAVANAYQAGERSVPDMTSTMVGLFVVSMALLIVPKLLAIVSTVSVSETRKGLGGVLRVLASAIVETFAAVLFAPIIAVYHSRFVFSNLRGNKVSWNAQQRDEKGVTWSEATQQMWFLTLVGIAVAALFAAWQPFWLVWFAPVILGWSLSIPLTVMLGSRQVGVLLAKLGLLQVASERKPIELMQRHQYWISELEAMHQDEQAGQPNLFERLLVDAKFRQQHLDILRAANAQVRLPGDAPERSLVSIGDGGVAALEPEKRRRLLSDDAWLESLGTL